MSIKKLGGIRLRLATGLTAALAVCGAVVAFNLTPSATFNPSTVTETNLGLLELRNFSAGTYYLVPNDREVENNDSEGWAKAASQAGDGSDEYPFIFDEDTMAIEVVLEGSSADIYLLTDVVSESDDQKDTSIQVRSGSPTGTVVATGNISLLEQ